MSNLHAAIMTIAGEPASVERHEQSAYRQGHADARHAAAELAAAHLGRLEALAMEFDAQAALCADSARWNTETHAMGDAYRDAAARLRAVLEDE